MSNGFKEPASASTKMKRFMMIHRTNPSDWKNGKTLEVMSISPSKVNFIVFNNNQGENDHTSFTFYSQSLWQLLEKLKTESRKNTESYVVTLEASRRKIAEKPGRPSSGAVSLGKTPKGVCFVELKAEGQKTQRLPFKAIEENAILVGGKAENPNFEVAMINWLERLLEASDRITDTVYAKYTNEWSPPEEERVNITTSNNGFNKSTNTDNKLHDDDIPF